MHRLIESLILYLVLTIFAIVGVLYLAPRIASVVSERLERTATVRVKPSL
jgi:hypothetical protein